MTHRDERGLSGVVQAGKKDFILCNYWDLPITDNGDALCTTTIVVGTAHTVFPLNDLYSDNSDKAPKCWSVNATSTPSFHYLTASQ